MSTFENYFITDELKEAVTEAWYSVDNFDRKLRWEFHGNFSTGLRHQISITVIQIFNELGELLLNDIRDSDDPKFYRIEALTGALNALMASAIQRRFITQQVLDKRLPEFADVLDLLEKVLDLAVIEPDWNIARIQQDEDMMDVLITLKKSKAKDRRKDFEEMAKAFNWEE